MQRAIDGRLVEMTAYIDREPIITALFADV
jgi:hypothetical protein